jgi:hypothetical protein
MADNTVSGVSGGLCRCRRTLEVARVAWRCPGCLLSPDICICQTKKGVREDAAGAPERTAPESRERGNVETSEAPEVVVAELREIVKKLAVAWQEERAELEVTGGRSIGGERDVEDTAQRRLVCRIRDARAVKDDRGVAADGPSVLERRRDFGGAAAHRHRPKENRCKLFKY